jgi:D-glycero-alpha-D-manno-heptose-7-phosphate kinase
MIISKTPFRISFMGGGTDLRAFYRNGYGAVVTTSIDKFVYLAIHRFFERKIVLKYSQTETVDRAADIRHPLIRECMLACEVDEPLELTSFADIPSTGSGLGSSSAFSVGLIKALHAFRGREVSAERCAAMACDVEIERLGEPIGKQDQYAAACGGLNYVRFNADETVFVEPIALRPERMRQLQGRLMMFYTGVTRNTRDILAEQKHNTETAADRVESLSRLLSMTETLRCELAAGNIDVLGDMLHESWMQKRQLARGISSPALDEIYTTARRAGAKGGKILGAGGGGFFLFDVPLERQPEVADALGHMRRVRFGFEQMGTRTLYYQDDSAE